MCTCVFWDVVSRINFRMKSKATGILVSGFSKHVEELRVLSLFSRAHFSRPAETLRPKWKVLGWHYVSFRSSSLGFISSSVPPGHLNTYALKAGVKKRKSHVVPIRDRPFSIELWV